MACVLNVVQTFVGHLVRVSETEEQGRLNAYWLNFTFFFIVLLQHDFESEDRGRGLCSNIRL